MIPVISYACPSENHVDANINVNMTNISYQGFDYSELIQYEYNHMKYENGIFRLFYCGSDNPTISYSYGKQVFGTCWDYYNRYASKTSDWYDHTEMEYINSENIWYEIRTFWTGNYVGLDSWYKCIP